MEVFEVHITGNDRIHDVAKRHNLKTITIDLLKPDRSYLRTEHMTSLIFKYGDNHSYQECYRNVVSLVHNFLSADVPIYRTKIECPFYEHYADQSLYMESHFEAENNNFPMSRNQRKETILATDRTYNQFEYNTFRRRHSTEGKELELCLFDNFSDEDKDWFDLYQKARVVHCMQEPDCVYIGRPSKWGNIFKIGPDGDRKEVIDKYREWIVTQPQLMADLHELKGKKLGCWCVPDMCHGHVLAELVNAL